MAIEERVARLGGIIEEIRDRLDGLDGQMDRLDARVNTLKTITGAM